MTFFVKFNSVYDLMAFKNIAHDFDSTIFYIMKNINMK